MNHLADLLTCFFISQAHKTAIVAMASNPDMNQIASCCKGMFYLQQTITAEMQWALDQDAVRSAKE